MADNLNQQVNPEYIQELLSAYLDGELTAEERALVEQALDASPELQQELESLRQTVALVKALPPVAAPRPFTLSEADVQTATSAPKRSFWRPSWAGGLALFAAAVVCVLIGGGVLFSSQFNLESSAPAEVALMQEEAASQAVEAETDQDTAESAREAAGAEAEMEEAAEEVVEPPPQAAPATEQEAALAEPAATADAGVDRNLLSASPEEEGLVGAADDEARPAAEQEETAETESAAQRNDGGALASGGEAEPGAPPATALPSPRPAATTTPTPQPTPPASPTRAAVEDMAAEEAPAEPEMAAPAQPEPSEKAAVAPAEQQQQLADADRSSAEPPAAPPAADRPDGRGPSFGQDTARRVEIQDLRLRVLPGLIQIDGFIEASPGTFLQASLLRDQLPFDAWAEADSLQSVVGSDGRITFTIRSAPGRTDADLFAIEPAQYLITITSSGQDGPIVTTVVFDTASSPAATAPTPVPPTSTSSPTPGPTSTPRATTALPPTPTVERPATATAAPESSLQNMFTGLALGGALILIVVVLIVVGIVIWFNVNKKG